MNHNNTIAISGVSGVGKDFLINRAFADDNTVEIVSTNRSLKRLVDRSGQDIRRFTCNEQFDLYNEELVNELTDKNINKNIILNTHLVHQRMGKLAVDDSLVLYENPNVLIHIESDPEIIAKRRTEDVKRHRLLSSVSDIEHYQSVEGDAVRTVSRMLGASAVFIYNSMNTVEDSVTQLRYLKANGGRVNAPCQLAEFVLQCPNSIVPWRDGLAVNIDKEFTDEATAGVLGASNSTQKICLIYKNLMKMLAYDEQYYCNFKDLNVLRDKFVSHTTRAEGPTLDDINVICSDMARVIATLIHAVAPECNMELVVERNVGRQDIAPHMYLHIEIDGRGIDIDPISTFGHSDLLCARIGMNVVPTMPKSQRETIDRQYYNSLIKGLASVDDLVNCFKDSQVACLPIVEKLSYIKNVVNSFAKSNNMQCEYNRFAAHNGDEKRLVAIFGLLSESDEEWRYIVDSNGTRTLYRKDQYDMELSGVIECISRNSSELRV